MTDGIRILHVEDDPDLAELVADFLEREDGRLDVETASDADEGLRRLAGEDFDCIVSDYDMPGRNGIEFLEAVRADSPDLPFILFTGKGSEEVASDAISAGATDYLQKETGTEQYALLANRVRNTVEQYRASRRAAEMDRIRTLSSDINQALVRAASRAEAETRVCEIVSESDPYRFAWIGEVDPTTARIRPRASAGVEAGYLEDITITVEDAPAGRGPAGTAIRERRVAVSQDVTSDPAFEPWRDDALERGFRAVAAIPLEYEDTLFGELVVYADRPDAFDDDERALLAELGDDVAHALHSFEVRDRLRAERDRRQALFENAPDPVIAASIEDGAVDRVSHVNDAFVDVFGYERADVVGADVADVIVPEDDRERHEGFRQRAVEGEATIAEVERLTATGPREFLLTVVPYGGTPANGLYAWFTDISEQRDRERKIEELHRTTDALLEAESPEAVAEITAEAIHDILAMPANGVYLYDEGRDELVPAAWTDETEAIVGVPPTFAPGEGIAGTAFESGESQIYDDVAAVPERYNPNTAVRSNIVLPLDDHGVVLIGSPDPGAFDESDVSLVQTLASHATTALQRIEREAELVRRTELFEAVLETSIDGILVVDENREYVTRNQRFLDMWGVPDDVIEDRPEAAALEWVLGELEHPDEFREKVEYLYEHPGEESRDQIQLSDGRVFDRYSAPVLADDGTYYGRVWFFRDVTDRIETVQELERQNERLEEFASVVSHDLRNPLNVAEGRLELAREEDDSEHLRVVASAHDRMQILVDDLLTLAQQGRTIEATEPVHLGEFVEQCWGTVETESAELRVVADATVVADESRLVQLVENLFRNAVDHGGDDVTVTVGDLDDGFYVEDDGPGIPADERERVLEPGYSTGADGTGFGLSIVSTVAEAHGWELAVTEGSEGGARIEVTGVEFADD